MLFLHFRNEMISKFYEDLVCGADAPRIFRGALKFVAKRSEVDKKLEEAAHQMMARHYGEVRLGSRELIRVALVYCAETRRFSAMRLPQSARIPK